jgi:hypothetical protein
MRRRTVLILASAVLIGVFAVVTYNVLQIASNYAAYALLLSAVSTLVSIVVVRQLLNHKGPTIHFWAMFVILVMGYYVKMGILALLYASAVPGLVELAGESVASLLGNTPVLMTSYELTTVSFLGFGLAVLAITTRSSGRTARPSASGYLDKRGRWVTPRFFARLLGLTTLIYAISVAVQLSYGVGMGFLRQEELPFRLAGILVAIQRYFVPLAFLFVIWGADEGRLVKLSRAAVMLYLLYGISYGLITTSKAGLIFVIASLAGLWISAGTLSARRRWLIVGVFFFSILFSGYLSGIRFLRADPAMSVAETIVTPLVAGSSLVGSGREESDASILFLAISLRSVGMDALLNIVAYAPSFSLDRWISILTGETSLDQIYGRDVLRLNPDSLTGTAFSPSLFGAFYILTCSIWATGILVFLYTYVWHMVFRIVDRSSLVLKPALLAILLLSVLLYTSEGTIETIPFTLGLIALSGLIGNYVIRGMLGKTGFSTLRRKHRLVIEKGNAPCL